MRTFAVAAAVCVGLLSLDAKAGFEVAFELDFTEASDATTIASAPGDRGPFTSKWEERGLEEITDLFQGYSGFRPQPKPSTAIDCKELFGGMWTTPSMLDQPSHGRLPRTHVPSAIPPFKPGSLSADLWPRTRACMSANDDRLAFADLGYVW